MGKLPLKDLELSSATRERESNRYFASEINKYAIQVTQKNFPNTIEIGDIRNIHYENGTLSNHIQNRIYDINGKSVSIKSNGGGLGANTGLHATNEIPLYEVKDGFITINNNTFPIKLSDGYYVIRKLSPLECERLQTLDDNYTDCISNNQRYKCIGNGWTVEVIKHILSYTL